MNRIKLNIASVIVDDDTDLLETLKRRLPEAGIHNFELFEDETDLIGNETDEIRVIIVDHKLSRGRTGLDVVKIMKHMNQENFIIGYSGIDDSDILKEYINSDIDRFVDKKKPNHIDKLIACIKVGIVEAERRTILFNYLKRELHKHRLDDKGSN